MESGPSFIQGAGRCPAGGMRENPTARAPDRERKNANGCVNVNDGLDVVYETRRRRRRRWGGCNAREGGTKWRRRRFFSKVELGVAIHGIDEELLLFKTDGRRPDKGEELCGGEKTKGHTDSLDGLGLRCFGLPSENERQQQERGKGTTRRKREANLDMREEHADEMALDLLKEATDKGELFIDGFGTKTVFVVTHKDQDLKGLTERGVGLEELIKLDDLFTLKHKRLEEDFDDARFDLV